MGVSGNAPIADEAQATRTAGEIADWLEQLGTATGDRQFARAARTLRQGTSPGRPLINDDQALSEAQWLLETGKAKTLNGALERVSRSVGGYAKPRSVVERLRRKIRQRKNSSTK